MTAPTERRWGDTRHPSAQARTIDLCQRIKTHTVRANWDVAAEAALWQAADGIERLARNGDVPASLEVIAARMCDELGIEAL